MKQRVALVGVLALTVAAAGIVSMRLIHQAGSDDPRASRPRTFGDVMRPYAALVDAGTVNARHRARPPAWGRSEVVGWDDDGAFTYSLTPRSLGTSASEGDPGAGVKFDTAGFYAGSTVPKNSDVTFTLTGHRFAIRYVTFGRSDAMVWIDGKQVSAQPFTSVGSRGKATEDWIMVTLSGRRTVDVRFAGPFYFSGIEYPAGDEVSVQAAEPHFTMGVVSDSFFETSFDRRSMSTSAAPSLSTLTGFRIWNLAQGGTGYLNNGSDPLGEIFDDVAGTGPYGSAERLDAVVDAPIDALLVNGSINDAHFSVAKHRAAVDRFLTEIEARRHTLPIVLVGLEPISTSDIPDKPTEKFVAMTHTLKQMAAKHPNVVGFIDPYTPNWFTGTGSTNAPTGKGNQDEYIGADGIHPNGAGQVFYQRRIVGALKTMPINPLRKGP